MDEHKYAAQIALKDRLDAFNTRLEEYVKEVESFREKTDGLKPDEIKRNCKQLEALRNNIDAARKEVGLELPCEKEGLL